MPLTSKLLLSPSIRLKISNPHSRTYSISTICLGARNHHKQFYHVVRTNADSSHLPHIKSILFKRTPLTKSLLGPVRSASFNPTLSAIKYTHCHCKPLRHRSHRPTPLSTSPEPPRRRNIRTHDPRPSPRPNRDSHPRKHPPHILPPTLPPPHNPHILYHPIRHLRPRPP